MNFLSRIMNPVKPIVYRLRGVFSKPWPHEPLVWLEISKSAILHNLKEFRQINPRIAPVLKSNAYGHDMRLVAKILDKENCPYFIVDSLYEAHVLRQSGIRTPLLIIGYTRAQDIIKHTIENTICTITSLENLRELIPIAKRRIYIHIKFDTGMHRQGIPVKDYTETIALVQTNPNIIIIGICSHFADADTPDSEWTTKQIEQWNTLVTKTRKDIPTISEWHIANTPGHSTTSMSPSPLATFSRLGIGLYGTYTPPTLKGKILLKPAMEMKAVITGIKDVPRGSCIGYNCTADTSHPHRIATISAGYYEGIFHTLSNKGSVLIGKSVAPIIGKVSMNITTIDITDIPDTRLHTIVTLISNDPNMPCSESSIARITGRSVYEIPTLIPAHIRRIIIA